jgi:drug/metabolite transporter (DMT)-like permease
MWVNELNSAALRNADMTVTILVVLVIVLTNAAGDLYITRGMKQVGEIDSFRFAAIIRVIKQVLASRDFILGVFFLALSFFAFLAILSWADMSFVVPTTSLVYVVTLLGARFALNEQVDRMRWAGTFLVCLGVALICFP